MTTLFIPVPPGTTTVRYVARVAPGTHCPGCAVLPAYARKRDCVEAHPHAIPWPVRVECEEAPYGTTRA